MQCRIESAKATFEGADHAILFLTVRLSDPGVAGQMTSAAAQAESTRFAEWVKGCLAEPIARLTKLRADIAGIDSQIGWLEEEMDGQRLEEARFYKRYEIGKLQQQRHKLVEDLKALYQNTRRSLTAILSDEQQANTPLGRPTFKRPEVSAAAWADFVAAAGPALETLARAEVARNVQGRTDAVRDELLSVLGPSPDEPGGLRGLVQAATNAAASLIGATA